ncbi:serine/threonine-protein kinase [Isoptericola sp. 178]|uniref:serine/threonine-protein kinase n=1 Tax=Isoptericola sp. 178 TaxID=3064651 RepID=UPI00271255F9|nr:serine/threonine protein kinase [Isoptericola sp. 178]MDO8145276.1 protein kinase [Isoptericola sp. 178]
MAPDDDRSGGGVILGGRYVLGDVLGTGGTYTAYEATRVDAGPDDAEPALLVKTLHPHLVDDEAARAAMDREISASQQIDDPHVATVLDSGEDEVAGATVPWVLTRRFPGAPLSETVAGTGLPWREALVVVDGVLGALAAVHAAGLVHRDVSPRNVVVSRHEESGPTVGLIDLGLATPGDAEGAAGVVTGSALGMSPEQARGRPLDERSDVYAVGALAYYVLTGHPPYERATPDDVLRAHVGAPVPAPSARRAAVPAAVDRFVAQAMAKDPARRFASAAAMRTAVASLLGGSAAVAAPGGGASPDQTMDLGRVDEDDPHRTAALGAVGAAAAAAAVDNLGAELQRTRQIAAVEDGDAGATEGDDAADGGGDTAAATTAGAAGAAVGAGAGAGAAFGTDAAAADPGAGGTGADGSGSGAETVPAGRRRRWVLVGALALVLAAAVGAMMTWPLLDGEDEAPVVPVLQSPSPSPTSEPSPSPTTTGPTSEPEAPTSEPTSAPTRTEEPTEEPTSSPTPTDSPSPTDDPTTAAPEPEPTATRTSSPAPEPTATQTSAPAPEPTATQTSAPDPAPAPSEDADPIAEPSRSSSPMP